MYRSMMQIYVKESDKAFEFYQKAFNANVVASYPNQDGTFMHAELDVYGQILALSELLDESVFTGNSMQFCLHFGDGKEPIVQNIYNVLKEGAKINFPLGRCDFSTLMVDLTDKFGIRWCIFV